ncbi:P-loop containing nucleoside triphosphate hydrolase protein [Ephemerocybe angulata]|uniref:P-loop containing nucleoside triphosphate hydrolase protein n=1 Tax=Ephemerocybe angulata TaxID=980116 RepID=A0A8H6HX89_9AGAR|nr:P-loop containing nucleoside triphosphate hydrolase protein [Tulosesus angulatus]
MPKRQAAAVQSDASDDSDSGSERRASPKRTRTQHDEAGATVATQGRRRAGDGGESDGEGDADIVIPVAEDDAAFEAANLDNVRASIESGKKNVKGIAEYGILQAIEVEQFMCHQRLNFKFGEQINFIIGHNGSGKSAVLSALTIALGGKTNSTGRGSGLKSFIREGQHEAKITLKIKNEGPEAFKPDQYGDSIIIQRRFNKDGGSSWKIMDGEGKTTVSTKREELSAICDHMNVQVDNPMNVLTQDSARQFLSASHPHDKYKFFLMGTQLFQLSTEYDICLENIRKTAKVLVNKKEAIPDLRRAFNEALRRFKEAEKAREQKKKVDDLKKEKAWAHVNEKKEELEAKLADVQQKKLRIPKIQEKLDEAKVREPVPSPCVWRLTTFTGSVAGAGGCGQSVRGRD